MAGFGEFLINNMRTSLEPEDLQILNRNNSNSSCYYGLSSKDGGFGDKNCPTIKEEEGASICLNSQLDYARKWAENVSTYQFRNRKLFNNDEYDKKGGGRLEDEPLEKKVLSNELILRSKIDHLNKNKLIKPPEVNQEEEGEEEGESDEDDDDDLLFTNSSDDGPYKVAPVKETPKKELSPSKRQTFIEKFLSTEKTNKATPSSSNSTSPKKASSSLTKNLLLNGLQATCANRSAVSVDSNSLISQKVTRNPIYESDTKHNETDEPDPDDSDLKNKFKMAFEKKLQERARNESTNNQTIMEKSNESFVVVKSQIEIDVKQQQQQHQQQQSADDKNYDELDDVSQIVSAKEQQEKTNGLFRAIRSFRIGFGGTNSSSNSVNDSKKIKEKSTSRFLSLNRFNSKESNKTNKMNMNGSGNEKSVEKNIYFNNTSKELNETRSNNLTKMNNKHRLIYDKSPSPHKINVIESTYQYRTKMTPMTVNLAPSDADRSIFNVSNLSGSKQQQLQQQQQPKTLNKCKLKNREKLLQSWDKVIKKASKDPNGLKELLKLNTEKALEDYKRIKQQDSSFLSQFTENSKKTKLNDSSKHQIMEKILMGNNIGMYLKKMQQQQQPTENKKVTEKKKKRLKKKGAKSSAMSNRVNDESTTTIDDESRALKSEKQKNDHAVLATAGKQGELIRNLFSYLNNYGDDGFTLKPSNVPQSGSQSEHSKPNNNATSIKDMFTERTASDPNPNPNPVEMRNLSLKHERAKSESSLQVAEKRTMIKNAHVSFNSELDDKSKEESHQSTKTLINKTKDRASSKTSGWPSYLRCCVDRSHLGSSSASSLSSLTAHKTTSSVKKVTSKSESTTENKKKLLIESMSKLDHSTNNKLDLIKNLAQLDLDKLIQTLDQDGKAEYLKKKLSIYLKSKKLNSTSVFDDSLAETTTNLLNANDMKLFEQNLTKNFHLANNFKMTKCEGTQMTICLKRRDSVSIQVQVPSRNSTPLPVPPPPPPPPRPTSTRLSNHSTKANNKINKIYDNDNKSNTIENNNNNNNDSTPKVTKKSKDEIAMEKFQQQQKFNYQRQLDMIEKRFEKLVKTKEKYTRSPVKRCESAQSTQNPNSTNNEIEMFYFTSESPTRKTMMKNKTQQLFKGFCKHLQNQANTLMHVTSKSATTTATTESKTSVRPTIEGTKPSNEPSSFYFKNDEHCATKTKNTVANVADNSHPASHQYQHQNIFKTLFKSKTTKKTLRRTCDKCHKLKGLCDCEKVMVYQKFENIVQNKSSEPLSLTSPTNVMVEQQQKRTSSAGKFRTREKIKSHMRELAVAFNEKFGTNHAQRTKRTQSNNVAKRRPSMVKRAKTGLKRVNSSSSKPKITKLTPNNLNKSNAPLRSSKQLLLQMSELTKRKSELVVHKNAKYYRPKPASTPNYVNESKKNHDIVRSPVSPINTQQQHQHQHHHNEVNYYEEEELDEPNIYELDDGEDDDDDLNDLNDDLKDLDQSDESSCIEEKAIKSPVINYTHPTVLAKPAPPRTPLPSTLINNSNLLSNPNPNQAAKSNNNNCIQRRTYYNSDRKSATTYLSNRTRFKPRVNEI